MDQAESLLKIMKEREVSSNLFSNKQGPRMITVSSGKGGVGKTNFSVALALSLSQMGREVILMDADLGLANVNVIFGIIPKYNLLNVIQGQKSIYEVLIETEYKIKIIAGASGVSELANLGEQDKLSFIKDIEKLDFADIIIIDTGAGISDNVLNFILSSGESIIVTTPEPTSITDAYGIIKTIITKKINIKIKLIVNRVQSEDEGNRIAERIMNIVKKFLDVDLEYLGFIYEDAVISKSVIQQKPFYVLNRKSKASKCIDQISNRLEKLELDSNSESRGIADFFNRFFNISKSKK